MPFGTLQWSSSGSPEHVPSIAEAARRADLPVSLPTHLPQGVGQPQDIVVQPAVRATITFDSRADALSGASVDLTAGPGVLVSYRSSAPDTAASGGTNRVDVPTLGIVAMRRPTASTTGATVDQITSFLLSQPDVPPGVAAQLRLLGDLSTTLPVPVPAGTTSGSATVAGHPGVVIADPSGVAAGAVWEDGDVVRVVAGLVDEQSVLDVADQLW